ncbi:GAF and ANTAR domain-containing protein [Mycolicibacterium sp. ELW1]|uniref:GAF and ANTAR domain-containing protein n=1 Tax=Mycobacteriaceae TaxID=1762 RepID=UPI0011EBDFFA|nr:GAF and ANTAR domain-containing protein [Mycobacterium sp. ELW1]QEN12580.1 GAF and ANTAR domain-containing protein [Mycobacterium sp. ELW1]
MSAPRETQVLGAVVALVDSLLDDFDIVELLTDLTGQCARLLDVRAAGLLLAGPRQDLHLMAATSKSSHDLEIFQLQADEGPCLDCFITGQAISAPDLDAERARWPRFVPAATEAGFVSVHAVPMRAAGTLLGALGLFGTRLGALNDADLLVAHSLVHVACVAILQGHSPTPNTVGPSLRAALNDRVVVDQATGFVGETLGVPMEEAFRLLRQYAQNHPEHLTDIARQLVGQPARRAGILAALAELVPEV